MGVRRHRRDSRVLGESAGQPLIGRSGGGLFSADGHLIGVCNLADPKDDVGSRTELRHDLVTDDRLLAADVQPAVGERRLLGPP